MSFFRDAIWQFIGVVISAFGTLHDVFGAKQQEKTLRLGSSSLPKKRRAEALNFWGVLLLMGLLYLVVYALWAFVLRVFAPTIPFDPEPLGILVMVIVFFVAGLFWIYDRLILLLYLLFQYLFACWMTILVMKALKIGTDIYGGHPLFFDLRVSNPSLTCIIFGIIYSITFIVACLIYSRAIKMIEEEKLRKKANRQDMLLPPQ